MPARAGLVHLPIVRLAGRGKLGDDELRHTDSFGKRSSPPDSGNADPARGRRVCACGYMAVDSQSCCRYARPMGQNEPLDSAPAMRIVRETIALSTLEGMAESMFGNLVKAVIDIEQGILAVGGEMHADEEALLLEEGSPQPSLWGINLYPAQFGTPRFIEFDSVINIRPRQGNRTRSVDDAAVRAAITSIVDRLVTR